MNKIAVIEEAEAGVYLNLNVVTDSNKSGILEIDRWRNVLKVAVAAPPIHGKANSELIRFFEKMFPEVKGAIAITKGERTNLKKLFIPLKREIVESRLGLAK